MSKMQPVLHETRTFKPSEAFVNQANLSSADIYRALCSEAAEDYLGFWQKLARKYIYWWKPFTRVLDESNPLFLSGLTMVN